MSKYSGLTLEECMSLLVTRYCACGCGMSWKCLPSSKNRYARKECSPAYWLDIDIVKKRQKGQWSTIHKNGTPQKRKLTPQTNQAKILKKKAAVDDGE